MDHFFLVRSSVDGHFRCFQVLPMVNIAGVQDYQPVIFDFHLRRGRDQSPLSPRHEDTVRSWLSASQEEASHQTWNQLAP